MSDYLLFIDTETTGLPKDWSAPYAVQNSWPYVVQISWIIYTKEGEKIKTEDHYIRNSDFVIPSSAQRVHHISRNFLVTNGKDRKEVMKLLAADLKQFRPLVLGHFMKLDYHMAGVEFYRSDVENPMEDLPLFCTMLASTPLVTNPHRKYMRLGDLYEYLFNTPMEQNHNALEDAQATADCYFEMLKRGIINEKKIEEHQKLLKQQYKSVPVANTTTNSFKWLPVLIILLIFLILILIWRTDFNS